MARMGDDSARGPATDHAELRARLERHHREGYAWALSCCGWNAVEAENVLQSVYVKILEGSAAYGERSAFRTWLFAVIRHTAAQERRRNWWLGRKTVSDDDALESASIDDDPTDAIYRAELRAHLQKALASATEPPARSHRARVPPRIDARPGGRGHARVAGIGAQALRPRKAATSAMDRIDAGHR